MSSADFASPNFVPAHHVSRLWDAHDLHLVSGSSLPFDRARAKTMLKLLDGGASSDAHITRLLEQYGPYGTITPNCVWLPILDWQERPWIEARRRAGDETLPPRREDLNATTAAVVENLLECAEEEGLGAQVESALLKVIQALRARQRGKVCAALAMLLAFVPMVAYSALDATSDGRLNGVIRWCHVVAELRILL